MFNPICTQSDRLANCPLDIVFLWLFVPVEEDRLTRICSVRLCILYHVQSTFCFYISSTSGVVQRDLKSGWKYMLGYGATMNRAVFGPETGGKYVIVSRLGKRLTYIFFWSKTMWLNIFHRGPCNYARAIHFFSQHFKSTNGVFFT